MSTSVAEIEAEQLTLEWGGTITGIVSVQDFVSVTEPPAVSVKVVSIEMVVLASATLGTPALIELVIPIFND